MRKANWAAVHWRGRGQRQQRRPVRVRAAVHGFEVAVLLMPGPMRRRDWYCHLILNRPRLTC